MKEVFLWHNFPLALNILGYDFAHKIPLPQFAKIVALLKILCTFSIKLCRAETGINNQFRATPKIYNMILIQYGMSPIK